MRFLRTTFLFCISTFLSLTFTEAQNTVDFKITTLNAEWLSCSNYSPSNDELQMNNIVSLIKTINPDLIALQEVGTSSSYATIDTLVKRLGNEWAGNIVPWSADNCDQNQGIIYKKDKIRLTESSLVTNGGTSYNWSYGRYPSLYNMSFIVGNTDIPVYFFNIHAKASSDNTSYTRRKAASEDLKTLLDGSTYSSKKLIVLGDFNDYLTGTQNKTYTDSPYKNFVDDATRFLGITKDLYDAYYDSPVIDNIIISNELFDNYVAGSVFREISATQTISNYSSTTSDHTPVSAIFRFINTTGIDNPKNDESIIIYPNQTRNEYLIK